MHSDTATSTLLFIPDVPSVDAERLEMLRDLCSETDPSLLGEMLAAWENETARRLADARAALAADDSRSLKTAAHALKGSCSNIGVTRLSELSRRLERESNSTPFADELLAAMDTEFRHVQELLAAAHAGA